MTSMSDLDSDIADEDHRNAVITTITLDISNKHLKEVPKTIKKFSNIEFLYLSTNDIKSIPDNFFQSLPQLKWLDFRHNLLTDLPKSIGQHRELRTLLLQGNSLKKLPIELGNVPGLTGLNIADNPIEYPPKTVIQEGTQSILRYLRLELQSESMLIPELMTQLEELHVTENEGYLGSGEDDGRVLGPIKKVTRRKNRTFDSIESHLSHKTAELLPRRSGKRLSSSDTLITTQPRLPHRRTKFKSANPVARVRHSDHYIQKISQAIKEYEEKRMQAIKQEENSRTEMMVQRMRDRDALKMWRQQTFQQSETNTGLVDIEQQKMKKSNTTDYVRHLKQKSVIITDKETELRNKIRDHAKKLKQYHKSDQKKKSEAIINLQEASTNYDEMKQLNQEYRFKAFTGDLAD